MQANFSRVNFRKLVRDLADMYQDETFDVIVTELVANALDAKAREISVSWDGDNGTLVVADDGIGMDSEEFAQYHDFAAELKTRGEGIGFAGVGAKISFNIADRVITETRRDGMSNASDWSWQADGSLVWTPTQANRLNASGTRVEVQFASPNGSADVDSAYLIQILKRHYLPLFIEEFVNSYEAGGIYPNRPRFTVNGSLVAVSSFVDEGTLTEQEPVKLTSAGQPIGWGALGVSERDCPIGNNSYGVLLCTHGKVVKAELFGLSTGLLGTKLYGVVEVPSLIEYLTTNKSDLRSGPGRRSREFHQLLDPIRAQVKEFLAKHGVAVVEPQRNQLSSRLERELSKMIRALPELRDFDGLLRKSRSLRKDASGEINTSVSRSTHGTGGNNDDPSDSESDGGGGNSRQIDTQGNTKAKQQRSRQNQGPRVAFEEHPSRGETAWIDSNTIVINSGHAAYRLRTTNDQARLTYCMFAMGVALDKADLEGAEGGGSYVDKFVTAWGKS